MDPLLLGDESSAVTPELQVTLTAVCFAITRRFTRSSYASSRGPHVDTLVDVDRPPRPPMRPWRGPYQRWTESQLREPGGFGPIGSG